MKTNDFERGQKTGDEMDVVTIAINNVWGGRTKTGGHVSSYEKTLRRWHAAKKKPESTLSANLHHEPAETAKGDER